LHLSKTQNENGRMFCFMLYPSEFGFRYSYIEHIGRFVLQCFYDGSIFESSLFHLDAFSAHVFGTQRLRLKTWAYSNDLCICLPWLFQHQLWYRCSLMLPTRILAISSSDGFVWAVGRDFVCLAI
jgi:hypothetical protein